ncbi:MAG: hypothetical protein ACXWUG_18765, partial [Polyangiales bacterium]
MRAWLLALVLVASCKSDPTPLQKDPAATPNVNEPAKPANPAALMDPSLAVEQAPATYRARFVTSKGMFAIQVTREWAPLAADR